jgi:hypothetical protein
MQKVKFENVLKSTAIKLWKSGLKFETLINILTGSIFLGRYRGGGLLQMR